jgi:hypothetical protein
MGRVSKFLRDTTTNVARWEGDIFMGPNVCAQIISRLIMVLSSSQVVSKRLLSS